MFIISFVSYYRKGKTILHVTVIKLTKQVRVMNTLRNPILYEKEWGLLGNTLFPMMTKNINCEYSLLVRAWLAEVVLISTHILCLEEI